MDGMKRGDKFTIQGVRVRKDGTLTNRCKPGNETPLVVVSVHSARRQLNNWIETGFIDLAEAMHRLVEYSAERSVYWGA